MSQIDWKSKRHWEEDYADGENQYQNTCVHCGEKFFGHKYRKVCKLCAKRLNEAPYTIMTIMSVVVIIIIILLFLFSIDVL